MTTPLVSKDEASRFVDLCRWAYARAALVAVNPNDQRRLAWSVLVGALIGYSGTGAGDLIPDPPEGGPPAKLDALMVALTLSISSAFLDGPPISMFAGDDANEAWEEVLSRFIINSVRANVVILDRGRYDALVKGQR